MEAEDEASNVKVLIRRAKAWWIKPVGLNRWIQGAGGGTWELNPDGDRAWGVWRGTGA